MADIPLIKTGAEKSSATDTSRTSTSGTAQPTPAASGLSGGPATNAMAMIKCPKCGADAREIARFCPKCHMTLRYICPSCRHEQRHGGTCDKCGVDFVKYLGAVVSSQKVQSDAVHERLQSRSNLVVNLLLIPFTGGLHLLKYLFSGSRQQRGRG